MMGPMTLVVLSVMSSCVRTVELRGSPALIATVQAELAAFEGPPAVRAQCGALIATITATVPPGRLLLTLERDGRVVRRVARSPAFAAVIIDAWRTAGPRPLLRLPPPRRPIRPPSVSASAPRAPPTRGLVEGFATAAVSEDASVWGGGGVRVAYRFARWAPYFTIWTAYGRHAADLPSTAERWTGSALAGMSFIVEDGDWSLRPRIGVGAGFVRVVRAVSAPTRIDDGYSATVWGPRLEAGLTGAYRGWYPVVVGIDVGVELAPLAHQEPRVPDYASQWTTAQRRQVALVADPLMFGQVRLAFGWAL